MIAWHCTCQCGWQCCFKCNVLLLLLHFVLFYVFLPVLQQTMWLCGIVYIREGDNSISLLVTHPLYACYIHQHAVLPRLSNQGFLLFEDLFLSRCTGNRAKPSLILNNGRLQWDLNMCPSIICWLHLSARWIANKVFFLLSEDLFPSHSTENRPNLILNNGRHQWDWNMHLFIILLLDSSAVFIDTSP